MMSSRLVCRSAPRVWSRLTCSTLRSPATYPVSFLRSKPSPAKLPVRASFSTTSFRQKSRAGESDNELITKFETEISLEQEVEEDRSTPTSVKDYLDNGPFDIVDTEGRDEVLLTRTFGNEKIRISFSISDLDNVDPEADYQDRALSDEQDIESDNINQGGKNIKEAPEDSVSAADGEEAETAEGEGEQTSFPAQLHITIEKQGMGALAVEATAQDGMIIIDNIYHYKDSALAEAKTAEKAHQRQDLYAGPPFGNLDEDLQVLMERYLDERGINTALAVFVPDYIDMKEQREYERWLKNVKGFLEA